MYETLPPLDVFADLAAARALMATASGAAESDDIVTVEDRTAGAGSRSVSVRVYTPASARRGPTAAAVWVHGGGFAIGAPNAEDATCRRLCRELGIVMVAPDYRLAPEHPYPAGFEDCYDVLQWTAAHAGELGIDIRRIALGGHSSGAALAAGVACASRDRHGAVSAFLYLGYPVLDDRQETPSARTVTDARIWNREGALAMWKHYLQGADPGEGYAVPARIRDLSGLPPTYVLAAGVDPSRDEAVEFAARLRETGTGVELHVVPGVPHMFDVLAPEIPVSRRAVSTWTQALAAALSVEQEVGGVSAAATRTTEPSV
ncbi:alpha/beta hydrolase [Streptomyces longwoodensis]|uniref:alpha/beta hydrolase n=1 Tax=Streptomyces longwoodensis TaxID=68231 RepID=UPI0033E57BE1